MTVMHVRPADQPALHAQDKSAETSGLDEFVKYCHTKNRHRRKATWSEDNLAGRWRHHGYDEIVKRDKANLDIFWLKDKSLEDSDDLPDPDILTQEITDDLQTALDQFAAIAGELKE